MQEQIPLSFTTPDGNSTTIGERGGVVKKSSSCYFNPMGFFHGWMYVTGCKWRLYQKTSDDEIKDSYNLG